MQLSSTCFCKKDAVFYLMQQKLALPTTLLIDLMPVSACYVQLSLSSQFAVICPYTTELFLQVISVLSYVHLSCQNESFTVDDTLVMFLTL